MYIIAGLGNPEEKYRATRHNIGFDILDALASRHDITIGSRESLAMVGKGYICGHKVILAEPMTYMNKSGDSIVKLVNYYKADTKSELIVVYDDIALPVGKIRLRPDGSAGGHNGIKSIIASLGTQDFMRLRMGVGDKPKDMDLVDHVLGHFSKEDRELMNTSIDRACDAIESVITNGIALSMNSYN